MFTVMNDSAEKELDIYTTLEDAKIEIQRRWNDKELKKKVEEYLGGNIPNILQLEPRAFLTRQIASPDREFAQFYELASSISLKPLCWEYLDDIFVSANRDKVGLAKMTFFYGLDINSNPLINYEKVIDLSGVEEGKKFRDVETLWGENFVLFHHRLLSSVFPGIELYDGSIWFKSAGKNAKEYYPFFLSLFIRNGILFENFETDGRENEFTQNIFIPAFKKSLEYFGIKPLIVKIISDEIIEDVSWWSYPAYIKDKIKII